MNTPIINLDIKLDQSHIEKLIEQQIKTYINVNMHNTITTLISKEINKQYETIIKDSLREWIKETLQKYFLHEHSQISLALKSSLKSVLENYYFKDIVRDSLKVYLNKQSDIFELILKEVLSDHSFIKLAQTELMHRLDNRVKNIKSKLVNESETDLLRNETFLLTLKKYLNRF